MNAETVLAELRRRGVEVVAAGGKLRYRPKDAVDDDLRRLLAEHKAGLLGLLQAEAGEVRWRADAMRPQVPARGPCPFLTARPDAPTTPGTCWSCAAVLGDDDNGAHRVRCRYCVRAAQRVLNIIREGVTT